MPEEPEQSQLRLQRDIARSEHSRLSAKKDVILNQRNAAQDLAVYEATETRGSAAGFYILLAVVGLVLLVVAGVYLTRRQNQQEITVDRSAPFIAPPAAPGQYMPPDRSSAPTSQPINPAFSAPTPPPKAAESASPSPSTRVEYPVPAAPAPLIAPATHPTKGIEAAGTGDAGTSDSSGSDANPHPNETYLSTGAQTDTSTNPTDTSTTPSVPGGTLPAPSIGGGSPVPGGSDSSGAGGASSTPAVPPAPGG